MLATAGTVGAGHDNKYIKRVICHGWPTSCLDWIQEAGRLRSPGECYIVASLEGYVYLVERMYRDDVDEEQRVFSGAFSVLSRDERILMQRRLLRTS